MSSRRDLLNGPQRLHLAVLAASMEDSITEIERLIDPESGLVRRLTHYGDDLPRDFAERVTPILDALRSHVARFAEAFGLEPGRISRAASVRAYVSSELVRIDESGSRQLKGYGAVAPELGAVLEPALQDLRAGFAAVGAALHPRDTVDHGSPHAGGEQPSSDEAIGRVSLLC